MTVNLAPARERKEGTGFDLAIALAVLAASSQVPAARVARVGAAAELGLDGRLRPVGGRSRSPRQPDGRGWRRSWWRPRAPPRRPRPRRCRWWRRTTCTRRWTILAGRADPPPLPRRRRGPPPPLPTCADVRGQAAARRALEIAAAGGHNLLMVGPPGSGKTMLARRLPGILPPPPLEELLEITRIQSVAGLLRGGARACGPPVPGAAPQRQRGGAGRRSAASAR